MTATKNYFSQDVEDYMELNGFHKMETKGMVNGMVWRKGIIALQFWQNRIEMLQENSLGHYKLNNTYIGFDGHNIQHLIMLLHCMGAITIDSACKLAVAQENNVQHINKILIAMPLTANLKTRNHG